MLYRVPRLLCSGRFLLVLMIPFCLRFGLWDPSPDRLVFVFGYTYFMIYPLHD